eukprot:CAMPEP_0177659520 /NCGR_PEP_ID=MMETSP0447-20121125/17490_1 /TAXON_ID=0 /ORGANISM="Stygamoeba regulata, Strain BSH-02190019" /LENGTH=132 /DNA_ID=CAMNT_0019164403 /DNA_START=38 /DNA_END=436 /DNA_ORIENTATION=-
MALFRPAALFSLARSFRPATVAMVPRRSYAQAAVDLDAEIKHAVGDEKIELEAEKAGKDQFGPSVLRGPFGTKQAPVVVPTVYEERIVGCVGGPGNEHDLVWHVVKEHQETVCLRCGQFFKLDRSEAAAHHH